MFRLKGIEIEKCARSVQRAYWTFVSEQEKCVRKQLIEDQKWREKLRLFELHSKRKNAVFSIEMMYRKFKIRVNEKSCVQLIAAASCIQHLFRNRKAVLQVMILRGIRDLRKKMATRIQSWHRMLVAKPKLRLLKILKLMELKRKRKEKLQAETDFSFRLQGAAVRIQQRWKVLQFKRRMKAQIRIHKHRKAGTIQRTYRCYRFSHRSVLTILSPFHCSMLSTELDKL
jgi:hypothetical protein